MEKQANQQNTIMAWNLRMVQEVREKHIHEISIAVQDVQMVQEISNGLNKPHHLIVCVQ